MNLGTFMVKGTAVKNQHRMNTDSLDLRAACLYQQVTSNGTLQGLGVTFEADISLEICKGVCTKCWPLWPKKRMAHHRQTHK